MQLQEIPTPGYERVVRATDPQSGLDAIISVHSTVLGPALGGIRMLKYGSLEEAVTDVNRLSKGMTYKHAIAETGQGGGKAVINADPATDKSDVLFKAMGRFIDALGGQYIAAEDMNMTVNDLEMIRTETRWVSGLSIERGSSGNPSPVTAWGGFLAAQMCLNEVYGSPSFEGRRVAVQGVGAVGSVFARHCADAGATVLIADIDTDRARDLAMEQGYLLVADPAAILTTECELLAPCARGAVLNRDTIPLLNCRIVCGCANNQLAETEDGERLAEREILYAPDYVVNAGGVINIAVEFSEETYSRQAALDRCGSIPRALQRIFRIAEEEGITTAAAADRLAEARLSSGKR